MKVLVLNSGSSSVKYQLFDMEEQSTLCRGLVERIGLDEQFLTHRVGENKTESKVRARNHLEAVKVVLDTLFDPQHGVISDLSEIKAVGHRVVHAGEEFSGSVRITPEVKVALQKCTDLAPLHNPPNLMGIEACEELLPQTPQVGVFDTAFHATMPEEAYLYAIPYELYKKHGIRRYGFHGTSHRYVSKRAAALLGKEELRLISCHLGNGASVCAVKNGVSIDTSMGFTPLEGLVMGTRSGDIDPSVIPFLMEKEGLDVSGAYDILNKKSGLLGLSGISSDMRDIEDGYIKGEPGAVRAFKAFEYRLRSYIGAYAAALGGLEVLVFTAGIGENSPILREAVCRNLGYLGLVLDQEANNSPEKEKTISTPDSAVTVMVIPTNEELVIALDTVEVLGLAQERRA